MAGIDRFSGFTHSVHDTPQILGFATVLLGGSGLGAQHGGAVDDGRVDVARDQDGHVAGGGDEVHQDLVLALGAGHEDAGDLVAGFVHRGDDLVGLEGDEFHGCVVVEGEAVDGFVGRKADYGARHVGVGDWRAVAPEVAVEEEVAAEVGDGGGGVLFFELEEVFVEIVVDISVEGCGKRVGFVEGWMSLERVFEEFARGGLSSFGHPVVRDDGVAVRAPDTFDKNGVV